MLGADRHEPPGGESPSSRQQAQMGDGDEGQRTPGPAGPTECPKVGAVTLVF